MLHTKELSFVNILCSVPQQPVSATPFGINCQDWVVSIDTLDHPHIHLLESPVHRLQYLQKR